MAYCKKCGAYIPDGQTACLACGYDDTAENNAQGRYAAGAAGAGKYADARERAERREYDERRKERQEENRKWAEEEHRRRYEQRENRGCPIDFSTAFDKSGGMRHKALAIVSYLSILFILPLLLCPDDKFARFHAQQGLVLFIFGIICDVISAILPIGWLLTIFRVYCIFKGITNAYADKTDPLPIIGKYAGR